MSAFSVEIAVPVNHALAQPDFGKADAAVTLELSKSRTYDCALDVLGAYKLTGNFPLDLEIVLKDLGVLGRVTFEIKPRHMLSDCRHVEFLAGDRLDPNQFHAVMRAIKDRIGFDAARFSWAGLLQTARRGARAISV